MVVALDAGEVMPAEGGAADLAGSSFIIPDTKVKGGAPAVLRLRSQSSITGAMSLLNGPPLSVADKAKLPVALASGEAVIEGTVAFPLKKDREPGSTRFDVTGDLFDVASDVLIKDRALAANRLALTKKTPSLSAALASQRLKAVMRLPKSGPAARRPTIRTKSIHRFSPLRSALRPTMTATSKRLAKQQPAG